MTTKQNDILNALQEMRDEYWQSLEREEERAGAETRDYVVFELGGERYGMSSVVAREVLRIPRFVRVPRVPEHILGVINLRGQVVAVTDLRPILGLSSQACPDTARLIVAEASGMTTALMVERVHGIQSVEVETIEPFTEGLSGFPREAAEGQLSNGDGLLVLLNMEKIFSRPEFAIDQKGDAGDWDETAI